MHLMHTMFRVTDLERAIKFYTDIMGMKLIRQQNFEKGRFSLAFLGYGTERDNTVIELTHNWDTDNYQIGDAYGHIAIQCDNLAAICEKIKTSDGQLMSEPHKMQDGPVMAFAKDPEGYMIELLDANVFYGLEKGFD